MYAVPISLIQVLGAILDLYAFILIARALISWVSPGSRNKIVQFLYQITEPVLAPVRPGGASNRRIGSLPRGGPDCHSGSPCFFCLLTIIDDCAEL